MPERDETGATGFFAVRDNAERLSQAHGPRGSDRQMRKRALMPKLAAGLLVVGATLGLVALVAFQPPQGNTGALLATAGCAYLVAAVLWFGGRWIPESGYPVIAFVATVLISSTIYFWGNTSNVYVLYYLWIALYTCYFFSRRAAIAQLAFVAVCYALVLWQRPPPGDAVEAWLISVGSLTVAGLVIVSLRERVDRLVTRLSATARTDDLTGLLNRRGFHELLQCELPLALDTGTELSLVVGDLDRFKEINDRFGYEVADQTLAGLSAFFAGSELASRGAARIGGEEFALVLPRCDTDAAYAVAEELRSQIGNAYRNQPVPITISFGIATVPEHGRNTRELLHAADQALYAAKALGRNRSIVHNPEIAGTFGEGTHDSSDEMRLATVLALAEALDVRDAGTAKHSQTVGRYAEMTARELRLPADLIERVRLAGILHDVGKVGVPDSVLCKPGPLDDEEWQVMKRHPEIGARILEGADFEDIREWVLAHQERPDGRGYPNALRDDQIPLAARILSVADAYEAMTADRVYRRAMGDERAREELARCSGSQFDPTVVDAFLRALSRGKTVPAAQAA
ncbi:MAG: diguanylate cyclase [Solirubrobacterales bacterium]